MTNADSDDELVGFTGKKKWTDTTAWYENGKLKKFTIARDTWLRGEAPSDPDGDNEVRLLTLLNQRCCIGFLAEALGLEDEDIRNVACLEEVSCRFSYKARQREPKLFEYFDGVNDLPPNSRENVYVVNDDNFIRDSEREVELEGFFKEKLNLEVEFVDTNE